MSIKALQDYTFVAKYANYNAEKKRRETWDESIDRVLDMHIRKFPQIEEDLRWAFNKSKKKIVLGSQRALQFGGEQIEKKNAKMYNCIASYCDRPRFFQECLWLLLCGCGTGFSVQNHHIDKLPDFSNIWTDPKLTNVPNGYYLHVAEDSIEGWADCLGVLISSFFGGGDFPDAEGLNVEFDLNNIRPEGSKVGKSVGKAPGPEPLRKALDKIKKVFTDALEAGQNRFKSINCYDIVMHTSDAVLSGGIRRCIGEGSRVLVRGKSYKNIEDIKVGDYVSTDEGWSKVVNTFDQGVQETLKIKHGNGELICTPNHRIALVQNLKNEFIWKQASEIVEGDCLLFVDNSENDFGINKLPDFTYDKPLNSTTCKNIIIPKLDQDIAWFLGVFQGDGYVSLTSKSGSLSIAIHGEDIDQKNKIIECFNRFGIKTGVLSPSDKENCFRVQCKSKQLATYFHSFLKQSKMSMSVPDCIKLGTREIKAAYLQGILDADGSIKTRPKQLVCSVYLSWVKELQILAHSIGIQFTFKKLSTSSLKENWQPKYALVFKGSLSLNKLAEASSVGYKKVYNEGRFEKDYEHSYPMSYFNDLPTKSRPKYWHKTIASNSKTLSLRSKNKLFGQTNKNIVRVISVEKNIKVKTYDIEVENNHCFMCQGVLVHNSATICLFSPDDMEMAKAKTGNWFIDNPQRGRSNNSVVLVRGDTSLEQFQELMEFVKEYGEPGFVWVDDKDLIVNPCVEISFYPVCTETGESGWQACNLCEINGKYCTTPEKFEEACRAAAIIGTVQAAYTDMSYLTPASERILKKEALLGVSITGMMDNPDILFDPKLQRKNAKIILQENERIAKLIGINPTARATCVKPAGTTSCILGTASGIHPHHAKRYIRRTQANYLEKPVQHFRDINPRAVEASVWSANNTDDVISFCVEVPVGAKTKNDISAIELLEYVKSTQKNWVMAGKVEDRCSKSWLAHNVSNTITVKDDEWEEVTKYIYKNKRWFAGISLLSITGDKDYAQAPFTAIYTPLELVKMYGDATVFASGVITNALRVFDDNLWAACEYILGVRGLPNLEEACEEYDEMMCFIHGMDMDGYEVDVIEYNQQSVEVIKNEYAQLWNQHDWLRQAKQFADRYFEGDLKKMTYCLKDVNNWKYWCDLQRDYKDVEYINMIEEEDNTKIQETIACAGGACTLDYA